MSGPKAQVVNLSDAEQRGSVDENFGNEAAFESAG